jgi:hypothetical protein
MDVIIPWKSIPSWQQEINLSGITYHLRFMWNSLNRFWSISIFDRDQLPIILGLKLVINFNITGQYRFNNFSGDILTVDLSQDLIVIGRNDMGDKVQLFYSEPE